MKRYYLSVSFSFFLLLLTACDSEESSMGNFISTDFEFMPIERFENSALSNEIEIPSLKLLISTTEIYPCDNYGILVSQSVSGNELTIKFKEIQKPVLCLTRPSSATLYIDLPEGIDKLVFENGETVDTYNIKIDNIAISISAVENNFTTSLHEKTFRYPENTFAFIGGTNTDNTHIHEGFLNVLIDNSLFTEYEFQGEGRIPYQVISDGQWVNMPSRFFKYNNGLDFDLAGQLLIDFTADNITPNDGVSLSLTSWDNRNYHSWMYD